jgi:hypothetical protein
VNARFDRLRPRTEQLPPPALPTAPVDAAGRRALFSAADADATPAAGSILVDCSGCASRTVLSPLQAVRLLLPSLHLPLLRRGHPSWLRCPACHRRTWTRLGVQL